MKRLLLIAFTTLSIHAIAQTNSYPTTGDVTIYNYSPNLILQRNTTDGGFTEGIQTKLQDGTDNWYFGALHTGQWVVSKGNYANAKMTVLDNGNVGIGTTDPQAKLDVFKNATSNGNDLIANFKREEAATGGSGIVRIGNHNSADLEINSGYTRVGHRFGAYADFNIVNNNPGGVYGAINFVTNGTTRMAISANGNIGIGTMTPAGKLDLVDNNQHLSFLLNQKLTGIWPASADANTMTIQSSGIHAGNLAFATGNSEVIRITSGSNVGIGTTTPSAKLDIESSILLSYGAPTYGIGIKSTGVGGGGWARRYGFMKNSDNSLLGGFGAFGGENSLSYYWVGSEYDTPYMVWNTSGNVGIGTTNPAFKLDVLGTIRAKEVLVNLDGGADFVFEKDYKLLPIEHVANYVQENKHLPDIPSANEMVKNGVSMGDMQVKLLQKVEELTLYAIQQDKSKKELEVKLAKQESQYNALLEKVEMLTKQIEKK
jgi:hypothetical protein